MTPHSAQLRFSRLLQDLWVLYIDKTQICRVNFARQLKNLPKEKTTIN